MNWREKLGCARTVADDGSDKNATSVTSVTPPQNPPDPLADSGGVEESPTGSTELKQGIPWTRWKADTLNRLFADQGTARKPARITAETVTNQLKSEEPPKVSEIPTELAAPKEDLSEALRDISELLANAYRRCQKRRGATPGKGPEGSGDLRLANFPAPSVHGVVE